MVFLSAHGKPQKNNLENLTMKIVSAPQMKELDSLTIKAGTPGSELMKRAGEGAGVHILDFTGRLHPAHVKRFVILAGKGNNGGDAYVVAEYLRKKTESDVTILTICPVNKLKGDALLYAERLPDEIPCILKKSLSSSDFRHGDIIVDGLLGTGITGALKPPYDNWISTVNTSGLPVISLDIPSGLDGTSGKIETNAIRADLTITMGLPKSGLFLGRGPEYRGLLRVVDIGIPESFIDETESTLESISAVDIYPLLSRIPTESHKNTRGKVLIIGGSFDYKGAPLLASEAALRAGAGMVFSVLPESAGIPATKNAVIIKNIPDGGTGFFNTLSLPEIKKAAEKADAIVIGPGLSANPEILPVIKYAWEQEKPLVMDADALNLTARFPSVLKKKENAVITPHPGEMSRLLKGTGMEKLLSRDRISQAREFSRETGLTVVLKGHSTLIASPGEKIRINTSGSPSLSTAGTGDVLAGMIGTFLAQGLLRTDAASTGTFIHGLASELSPSGVRGLIADDLPGLIPKAMKEISPFA